MANIVDVSAFDDVYLLDPTDDVLGGINGASNKPLINLANRTRFVKDLVEALGLRVDALRTVGEIQMLGALGFVNTDYDTTGLGAGNALGWALCNGQNGTDNLQEKFVVGMAPNTVDYAAPGQLGGAASVILDLTQMPRHNHAQKTLRGGASGTGGDSLHDYNYNGGSQTGDAGSSQPHENRPPFYTVVYRQWIG